MGSTFFILMRSELLLMLILFVLLILKINDSVKDNARLCTIINALLGINLLAGFFLEGNGMLFNGMFHTSPLIAFQKNMLNAGVLIISLQASGWLKNHRHVAEFYMLLITSVLGMFYMISAGNFLMFYLGLELSAIPLAALTNFDLSKIKSSEAGVKMILSSAFASAIMLFGISILYGTTGTLDFHELPSLIHPGQLPLLALIFVFTGFAFKLSAVPFHLWTADVYEGAPVPVTAFLSVISKAAIVFVFISVLAPLFRNAPQMWEHILAVTIVVTIIVGNLFAIRQNNIKRFLAFSSIAQVGFILLGLSGGEAGSPSAVYFLLIYIFSNLGAFGVVALVADQTGKENISDYKGFYKTNKALAWVLALSLFSLAGVPPTAGFFGKMFLVMSGASKGEYVLVIVAALNMVVSLYYYLRVVKAMFVDENKDGEIAVTRPANVNIALLICVAGVVLTGFAGGLYDYIAALR